MTIVFAESCTAGLVSASLAGVAGASSVLAGSLVVYQIPSKEKWLNINPKVLSEHNVVSRVVAGQMAEGALRTTTHANISASITGHLGPDAPKDLDGIAYCGYAIRTKEKFHVQTERLILDPIDLKEGRPSTRRERQYNAAHQLCQWIIDRLQKLDTTTLSDDS